ncbi:helix-turn-helix domain-containing protein [Paenibacillus piri]|nr:helix-turn-helix domain-containing protein [Paenibacillus piri]
MEQLFRIPKLYTSILLESLHYAKVEKGWTYPNHRHFIFEFIYCASGSMEQWVNGQPFVLKEGDSLIVKSGLYHHTAPLSEDTEFFVFHFDVDMKEVQTIFQIAANPLIPSQERTQSDQAGIFSVSSWVKGFIEEFGETLIKHEDSLIKEVEERLASSVILLRMQMRILDFIGLLADYFIKDTKLLEHNKMNASQINLAHEVAYQLELHSGERLQINELAKHVGVNRSYLSSCFKQVYGIAPREYFTKIKARTAKLLLQNTDLTIEEISTKLDFSSSAHFSKFFLNTVGLSPLKYRNASK